MDKDTIAEYKGLVAFVEKREREQASDSRKTKLKTKVKNFYDSHSLAQEALQDPPPAGEPKIKPFAWPLGTKELKIKPKYSYHMTSDTLFAETLESTVHQQASYYFPGYFETLDLKAEDKAIQNTVKSTANVLQLLFNAQKTAGASSGSGHSRRRSQRHLLQAPQTKRRRGLLRARAGLPPLLNWQDMLANAQIAGWPSAVIERARARLTSYYCPSEMLNE